MTNFFFAYLVTLTIFLINPSSTTAEKYQYKILLLPLQSNSHILSFISIGEGLARRGHDVHILVSSTGKSKNIILDGIPITVHRYGPEKTHTMTHEEYSENFVRMLFKNKGSFFEVKTFLTQLNEAESRRLCMDSEPLLQHLQQLKFDIAIVDTLFFLKFGYLIPHRLGIPWVTYADFTPVWNVRVPRLPSFVPYRLLPYSDRMTFSERLINTVVNILITSNFGFPNLPEEIINKYKSYGEFDSMDELSKKSVLFIETTDLLLDYPSPEMPNVIQAGGLTVKPAVKPLPEHIRHFMEGASQGLILVTFGSFVTTLPDDVVEKFLTAFKSLTGYRVLWKLKATGNVTMPGNVLTLDWLQQNEILAHKKTKLFITHCGNNGQFEAMYHAVPMIGFPLFADQVSNAKRLEVKGYGIPMDVFDFTAEHLEENIKKILEDSSYKERISLAAEIFKFRLDTPVERVAYWVEHVIKFGGDHLRSAGNDLPLHQYLMLDILCAFLIGLLLLVGAIWFVSSMIIKKLKMFAALIKRKSIKSD